MKLARIDTFAVRVPRDATSARGGAGSPAKLQSDRGRYALAETYGTVYSRDIETLIIKLTTADGVVGWGEAIAKTGEVKSSNFHHSPPLFLMLLNFPRRSPPSIPCRHLLIFSAASFLKFFLC